MVAIPGYEVQELLSWGSQGDVFRGRSVAGECVAIKLVTVDRTEGDPQAMERLRREARLLAALDSPHVVKVREFLQGEEWSCLVLEFLAGERLDKALRRRTGLADAAGAATATPSQATVVLPPSAPPTPGDAKPAGAPAGSLAAAALCAPEHVAWVLDIAAQLARGVAEMHRVHLIHRDIKPQNVMLVDGRVVLIDFGFARRDGVTTMTQAGTAIGTLAYMGPELLGGSEANEASDVYALGATLYQCLTGAPPFGADVTTIRTMASRGRPRDVRRLNAAVDASLAAVVARCLEPDPRDRYRDAGEVVADLQRVARSERVRAPFSPGCVWRHHRRLLLTVGAALAVLLPLVMWMSTHALLRVAEQVRREVAAGDVPAAVAVWNHCAAPEQAAVVQFLNQLAAANDAEARQVASALGLAILRLAPRAHHRVALVPCQDQSVAPAAPDAAFVATDTASTLMVRPGRAWCFVMSSDRSHWWAPDDPRCLQLLLDVDRGDAGSSMRRLDLLPTEPAHPHQVESLRFPAGAHAVRDDRGQLIEIDIFASFAIGAGEVSEADLWSFRRTMADRVADQEALDSWLRHPDEPPAAAAELWRAWREVGESVRSNQPARLSFWEAHRFASWHGCRLPALAEWRVAACDPKNTLGTDEQRRVPEQLQDVDARPAWDVTARGVRNANSNIREWTFDRRDLGGVMAFFAAPGTARRNVPGATNGFRFSWLVSVGGNEPPHHRHGLRLCRTLQGEVAR